MKKLGLFLGFITLTLTSVAQSTEQSALTLTLEQALEIALSENPTIKVAEQEIEIKRFAKQEAYSSLYPRFDATAQYQRVLAKQTMSMDFGGQTQTIKVGSDNSFNGGVTASMPVVNAQLWESLKLSVADIVLAVEKARSSQIDMIEQVSRAYFSWLFPKKQYTLDTNLNGGERPFVVSGLYEQYLPMDIYPVYLLKACLAGDIDKMENLGIYEVVEEDIALCEFVDPSKIEMQQVLRNGINLMIKEA